MLGVLVRCLDGHLGGFRVGLLVGHRGRGRCQAETRGNQGVGRLWFAEDVQRSRAVARDTCAALPARRHRVADIVFLWGAELGFEAFLEADALVRVLGWALAPSCLTSGTASHGRSAVPHAALWLWVPGAA